MSNYCKDIFDFIKQQEAAYRLPIRINDSWDWSMRDHIQTSENYANSQLNTGKDDYTPVKNITRPNLNLQHWTEDVDEKDAQIYINDDGKFHLSLLVKKYHDDVFVKENDLDTYFDELKNSRIDLGAGLSKKLNKARPECVPLQDIVFCNQRDLLGGPLGIIHEYSPSELYEMEKKGWGDEANGATHTIEQLVTLWHEEEKPSEGIKIYEIFGTLPVRFRDPEAPENAYEEQMFICAFYQTKGNAEKQGVILYAKQKDNYFKLIKRDAVHGRALGFGGAEELFEAQVWTNYDMIRMQKMLDAAAVTILKSSDPTVIARHPQGLKNMKNLEIIDAGPANDLSQVDTFPRNMRLFETSVANWEQHAKELSGAQDPLQGVAPTAGTPFKSYDAQIQQGMGLHKERRKQFARHIEEIYNDWIIPHIKKEITNGYKFLSELSMEEMQFVTDRMAIHAWNSFFVDKVLSGGDFAEGEKEAWMEQWKTDFKKKGNKHFIEVLAKELKDAPLKVSVAASSSNLGEAADKITKIFQFMFANPQGFAQVMQIPGMAVSFNKLLEFSGMSPADFSDIEKMAIAQPQTPTAQPSPLQLPAQAPVNG